MILFLAVMVYLFIGMWVSMAEELDNFWTAIFWMAFWPLLVIIKMFQYIGE